MAAAFHDAPLFQHKDGVGMQDGRQPVGDQDGDALAFVRQRAHRGAHLLLRQRIEGRGRFVENQQGRLADQCARDRQALAFAARELHAHLADDGVEARVRFFQQIAARGLLHGGDDVGVAGVGFDEFHVLAQGAGKQVGFLGHETDLAARQVEAQRAGRHAVVTDRAGRRRVQPDQQFDQGRLAGAGRADESDGLSQRGRERHIGQGVVRRAAVPKAHLLERHLLDRADIDGARWPPFDRLVEQGGEVEQGRLGLAPGQDDVAQFLQGREDCHRNKLHGDQLARAEHVAENQPQQGEQHGQFQHRQRGALQKGQQADPLYLLHLEREDGVGLGAQATDLKEGQTEALDQLDIAQRLGDEAGVAVRFARDRALLALDLAAEQTRQPAQHQHADDEHRHQQPMLGHRVPHQKADADNGGKAGIDEGIDKTLAVGAHFLQQRQGLAAAQVFEFLVFEAQQMAQTVVEDRRAQALHHQPGDVFLHRLRQPRQDRHHHCQRQQAQHAADHVRIGQHSGLGGEAVNDTPENDRVDQGQHLAGGGQQQGEGGEAAMRAQIIPENVHAIGLVYLVRNFILTIFHAGCGLGASGRRIRVWASCCIRATVRCAPLPRSDVISISDCAGRSRLAYRYPIITTGEQE